MWSPTHKTLEAITMSDDEDVLTETPQQEEPKERTKLDQFIELLSGYPDAETAKTHLSEIAEKLHCARSLGYKALKKIDHFKPRDSIETRAKEATVKITQPPEQPLEQQEEPLSEELPPEPEREIPPAAAVGFKDKDVTWMFDKGFKMLADVTGYADWKLDPDDSKRLGEIWTPIINQYLPDILPYAPIAIAAITTIVIVVPKVKGWWTYRKKKTKPNPEPPKEEPPKEEPKPEPSKTEPPPPLEKDVPATERPMTAPFLEKL